MEVHGALLYVIYDSYDKGEKKTISIGFYFLFFIGLFLLLSNKCAGGYISKIAFERNRKEFLYLLSLSVIIQ